MTQPHDAGASPVNPLMPNMQPPSGIPGGMRSIFERMTNPTSQDMQVSDRLRNLSRSELDRIMTHFGMVMEHLAVQRDDITVKRSSDATSWSLHVVMTPNNVPDPTGVTDGDA